MQSKTQSRKIEHIQWVLSDPEVDRNQAGFDRLQLIHRALPELDYDEVDTSTSFLARTLAAPLLISSMTGGDHPQLLSINRNLAQAAQQTGTALAVGSMRVALESVQARASFDLRALAPDIPLLANLGAVQLNYGCGIDECRRLVDYLQADALILHLNPLQEVIQPEGNRNFKGLLSKIEALISQLPVPLIIKEVGSGFSAPDLLALSEIGVEWVDVAGRGGTSWSRIEARRGSDPCGLRFQDWGVPTPKVIQLARQSAPSIRLIASGGVRTGLDLVKSLVLGAQMGALAKPLLAPAIEGVEPLVELIEWLKREIKVGMFLLGQSNVNALIGNKALILENGYE